MKITYKGDYALKAMLNLTLHYGRGVVTIHEMAERLDIPLKFLEQVLLDLKRGGFLESRRGKVGGYLLAKPPSRIKLGEVVRFINGPIEPIPCVDKKYKGCSDIDRCVFRNIWCKITRATCEIIDELNFEDLAKKAKGLNSVLVYQI